MRSAILLILLSICVLHCHAQELSSAYYKQDSFNIRLHVTGIFEYILQENGELPYTIMMPADNGKGEISAITSLLCDRSLGGRAQGVSAVSIKLGPDMPYFISQGYLISSGNFPRILDSCFSKSQIYRTIKMHYNPNGLLEGITSFEWINNKNEKGYETDTMSVLYGYGAAHRQITIEQRGVRHLDKGSVQSMNCGNLNGPFDMSFKRKRVLEQDDRMRLRKVEDIHGRYINDCNSSDPEHHLYQYSYDEYGRLRSLTDSSAVDKHLISSVTSTIKENSLEKYRLGPGFDTELVPPYMNVTTRRAISLPIVKKFFASNGQIYVVQTETTRKFYKAYDYKNKMPFFIDTPKVTTKYNVSLTDSRYSWFSMDDKQAGANSFSIYQYGTDSLGDYKGKYLIAGIPDPDSSIFDPAQIRTSYREQYGCVSMMRLSRRNGALHAYSGLYSERKMLKDPSSEWTKMEYNIGDGDRHDLHWTPTPERTGPVDQGRSGFILLDKERMVRYIYYQNTIYKLTYQ